MVPQLDYSYYFSQVVWLAICLIILVIFFKKIFLPKMTALIAKRDRKIYELKLNIESLSKKYEDLISKIHTIDEQRISESKKIISDAKAKCDRVFNDKMQKLQRESIDSIKKFHTEADAILSNLSNTMDGQIEEIAQQLFEKLFSNGENK